MIHFFDLLQERVKKEKAEKEKAAKEKGVVKATGRKRVWEVRNPGNPVSNGQGFLIICLLQSEVSLSRICTVFASVLYPLNK